MTSSLRGQKRIEHDGMKEFDAAASPVPLREGPDDDGWCRALPFCFRIRLGELGTAYSVVVAA